LQSSFFNNGCGYRAGTILYVRLQIPIQVVPAEMGCAEVFENGNVKFRVNFLSGFFRQFNAAAYTNKVYILAILSSNWSRT